MRSAILCRAPLRQSRPLRPSLLVTLAVIWFVCAFAPAVCIVHCQILISPEARAVPPSAAATTFAPAASRAHLSAAPAMLTMACAFIAPRPASPDGLPPISSLPRVLSDILPAAIAGLPIIALAAPLILSAPAAPASPAAPPQTPPPRAP